MTYNAAAVRASRARKDSAARTHHRQNQYNNAPFVKGSELVNGSFRGRLWPSDPKKNPLGFLDYRTHNIPIDYVIEDGAVRRETVQCPRSSNWDPYPTGLDEFGLPVYKVRCRCCELDEYVSEPAYDGAANPVEGTELLHDLPDHLKDVFGYMNWRSSRGSSVFFPMSLMMEVESKTKTLGNNGQEYENILYKPSVDNRIDCLYKFSPDARLLDKLFSLLEQDPGCSDAQFGRWFTLTKQHDGKGTGGYDIVMDLQTSPAGFEFDYNIHSDFTKWGLGGKTKASRRKDVAGQLAVLENCAWTEELRRAGIPLTDEEATCPLLGT